jgi:hypothetical protein
MRGRAVLAAFVAAFCFSCASVPDPHPTPQHKVVACVVLCPAGYALRPQHICRSDRTQFKDILISGEENDPNNPQESRWLTGAPTLAVERLVIDRLAAAGARPTDADWSKKFSDVFDEIRADVGNDAFETYAKIDVVLQTCSAVIQMRCGAGSRDCAAHPGEPDPRRH